MAHSSGDGASGRRRAKAARRQLVSSAGSVVRVSILTGATSGDEGVDLRHDVRLVRSALLYADEVELISPMAALLTGMATEAAMGPEHFLDILEELDDRTLGHLLKGRPVAQWRQQFRQLRALTSLPRAQRRQMLGPDGARAIGELKRALLAQVSQSADQMSGSIEDMWERAGAPDLVPAAEAGILTVSQGAFGFDLSADEMADRFAELIQRLIVDPTQHLMFDEQMGAMTKRLLEERPYVGTGLSGHSKRASLGAGLVSRIPAFPDAPMEAILQVRDDLADPLGRYRVAVGRMSQRLNAGPVDTPDLSIEIHDMWNDEVQPALRQLHEGLAVTAFGAQLAGGIVNEKSFWGSTASMGASFLQVGVADLTPYFQPAALTAGAGLALAATAKAATATHEKRKAAKTHDLYYLLALNDRLAEDRVP